MKVLNPIKISLKNLMSAKWRSFLTVLGIIIGVASVIIVMAIGSSAQALILDQVKSVGSTLIGVLPGASDENGPPASAMGIVSTTLTYKDLQAILEKRNAPHVSDATGYVTGIATTQYKDVSVEASYQGVTSAIVPVENLKVAKGRFFNSEESTNLSRVVVLGSERATDLFGADDPIGKVITIKDLTFTVVGVMESRGGSAFSNQDQNIFIPLFTAQKMLLGINYLNFIRAKVDGADYVNSSVEDVKQTLREQHKIKDSSQDDFSVRNVAQAIDIFTKVTNVLKYFLTSIAAISLLVGGVGIMNIMLISVNQRIREIGLRKAVGAQSEDVVTQFLVESVVITLVGGVVGIIFGILVSYLAAVVIRFLGYDWTFLISAQSIAVATTVSIIIGIAFGLYPALKASRVSPMEALRYE